jgi:hypothetical protein
VYIGYTLVTHDTGEAKAERAFEGWRRLNSLAISAVVEFPFERELLRIDHDRQFFLPAFDAITGQRHDYDARVYFYKYDPVAEPSFAASWKLPNNRQACEMLYAGGDPVDKTP